MTLLARKRGIFWIIYLFFKGIMRGDPVYIGIAVVLVLVIVGFALYKRHQAAESSPVADYAKEFQPPGTIPEPVNPPEDQQKH